MKPKTKKILKHMAIVLTILLTVIVTTAINLPRQDRIITLDSILHDKLVEAGITQLETSNLTCQDRLCSLHVSGGNFSTQIVVETQSITTELINGIEVIEDGNRTVNSTIVTSVIHITNKTQEELLAEVDQRIIIRLTEYIKQRETAAQAPEVRAGASTITLRERP